MLLAPPRRNLNSITISLRPTFTMPTALCGCVCVAFSAPSEISNTGVVMRQASPSSARLKSSLKTSAPFAEGAGNEGASAAMAGTTAHAERMRRASWRMAARLFGGEIIEEELFRSRHGIIGAFLDAQNAL